MIARGRCLVKNAFVVREIRERRLDLPVVTVTAYSDEERRLRAREYGAAEFITKPVDCFPERAVVPVAAVARVR